MKKSHLYTRGGDSGTTSLIGGSRIKKCSPRLDAYGTIDELSAHVGLLAAILAAKHGEEAARLRWIQSRLFDVGTHLAMPCTEGQEAPCTLTGNHVQQVENYIDELDAQLPALHTFVLPGGGLSAAQCHVCRTVCRRAERLITALTDEAPLCPDMLAFVNRLSDFFFVYARFLNKMDGIDEIYWQNDCN